MELRRLSICLAFVVVACLSHCSEAHSAVRRAAEDVNYDEVQLADAASDDEAQNDAEGNDEEDVVVEDAVIVTAPTNYSASIGGDVRLECRVIPAEHVVVQWRHLGINYFIGTLKTTEQDLRQYGLQPRITIAPNSTDLLIRDVRPADDGEYTCEILQSNRPTIVNNLSVLESPKIQQFTATDNGKVVEGADLILTCDVTGSPPPQIVWSRDGQNGNERLHERDGEFFNNSVLIRNVKREHSGKYYCYAFNTIGSNQAEVNVHVKGKPRVHVHRTVVNSGINIGAVLECTVHEPELNIRWYKDNRLIEDSQPDMAIIQVGQHSNLTVVPRRDEDFGTFTCEAENDLGKHSKSVDLVEIPVIEGVDVDGPKLSWTIHSHQPLEKIEIQLKELGGEGEWKTIDVPLPATQSHMYEVVYSLDGSLESGKYESTVRVKNEKGWSAHSDGVLVDIEAQPQSIQTASVFRGSGHSLRPVLALITTLMYLLVRM